jgi:hypothetical protein
VGEPVGWVRVLVQATVQVPGQEGLSRRRENRTLGGGLVCCRICGPWCRNRGLTLAAGG